ncbi:MAG: hypothetical protein FVQ81_05560 [Candidatus Glassbacteria bacterium]|nr:hypothetical protein [Candidatus Glassbacteria bacterium]
MSETSNPGELLEAAAKVLIRCFWMGVVILLFWGVTILLARDLVYSVHSTIFPMSPQQFYAIQYVGLSFTKVCVFIFFLLPYISIKLVQRKLSIGRPVRR